MAPISYWHDSLEPGDDLRPRSPLGGDTSVDVAIIGAGGGAEAICVLLAEVSGPARNLRAGTGDVRAAGA